MPLPPAWNTEPVPPMCTSAHMNSRENEEPFHKCIIEIVDSQKSSGEYRGQTCEGGIRRRLVAVRQHRSKHWLLAQSAEDRTVDRRHHEERGECCTVTLRAEGCKCGQQN